MLLFNISIRQKEGLLLVADKYSTQEIATTLFLSPQTVDSYKEGLKSKLHIKNDAGQARRGFEIGILTTSETFAYR